MTKIIFVKKWGEYNVKNSPYNIANKMTIKI